MLVIALLAMMVATLAQHIGFSDTVITVAGKIAQCPKCLSFWCALGALVWADCDPLIAIGLSFLVSYLSYWWGLVLIFLNNTYDKLWQRVNKEKK